MLAIYAKYTTLPTKLMSKMAKIRRRLTRAVAIGLMERNDKTSVSIKIVSIHKLDGKSSRRHFYLGYAATKLA